jgi:MFS transporter, FHS family, L-fucose permease
VLGLFAMGALASALIASLAHGSTALYGLMAIGLFHSIMFPTIFALAIRGLGPLTEEGSGLLIMAIAGGALVFIQGSIADHYSIQWSFLVTAACELYVIFYALWGCKPAKA